MRCASFQKQRGLGTALYLGADRLRVVVLSVETVFDGLVSGPTRVVCSANILQSL